MVEQSPPPAPRVPSLPPGRGNGEDALFRELNHVRELFEARLSAHAREHALLTEAVLKAEGAVSARLEGMNELRAQINQERGTYATREGLDSTSSALGARMTALERAGLVSRSELDARLAGPEAYVTEMDLKANSLAARVEALIQDIGDLTSTHQINRSRIESLEQSSANLTGRFAVYGAVAAFLLSIILIGASVLINVLFQRAGP